MLHVAPTTEATLHIPPSKVVVPQMQDGTPWSGPTSQQLPLLAGPVEHAMTVAVTAIHAHAALLGFTVSKTTSAQKPKATPAPLARGSRWGPTKLALPGGTGR
jgi:hypothetical protein